MFTPTDFFDLSGLQHGDIFADAEFAWDPLRNIHSYLLARISEARDIGEGTVLFPGAYLEGEQIKIGRNCLVEAGAYIRGPVMIGDNVTISNGAYIRGDVLIEANCHVGHTSEIKNSILLPGSKAPHFSYVGDSILGANVNLGAGTKLSNLKMLGRTVAIRTEDGVIETGLRKFGAILGDGAETGCNVVLNPGTLVGPRSLIYPGCSIRGYIPPDSIVKIQQQLQVVSRSKSAGS